MDRKILITKEFTDPGDFTAVYAALNWLRENGYSVGSGQAHSPRGILKGDNWAIAKWRNLSERDRAELDGIMVGGRNGPVTVTIFEGGKRAEIEASVADLERRGFRAGVRA